MNLLALYTDHSDQVTLKLVESPIKRGTWRVWVISPICKGFLRQGFAWKTKRGAEQAATKKYPRANFIS